MKQQASCLRKAQVARVKYSFPGGVAKWLCSGLQSRLRRFDSDPRLQFVKRPPIGGRFVFSVRADASSGAISLVAALQYEANAIAAIASRVQARVVKLVDTADLKPPLSSLFRREEIGQEARSGADFQAFRHAMRIGLVDG